MKLIVYGGAAIEYYLSGSHSANDVDIKCSNLKRVTEVLCNAGFTRSGEVFWHTKLRAPIQLCDDDGERRTSISVKGYKVHIITVEQAILNYTHKFIENGDNLEPVFVADLIEKYKAELDFPGLLERASCFGNTHYHVLRAIIALKAERYFINP